MTLAPGAVAVPSGTAGPALPRPPVLERLGVAYFHRLSRGRATPRAEDAVHVLNAQEQQRLRRIERRVVLRAAVAGAASAAVAAAAEVLAAKLFPGGGWQRVFYWELVGGAAAVAAAMEVAFLYADSLASAHALADAAGLDPLSAPAVAGALARAALELPNPRTPQLGVDPLREISRLRLALLSTAYKLKVGATSFLAKALLRRVLGRTIVRVWLAFVAVPVSAFWDAVVAFRAIREARVRTMGPSFALQVVAALRAQEPSPPLLEACARAAACAVVCSHDLHPNLLALLRLLLEAVGHSALQAVDDPPLFLRLLESLSAAERRTALEVLDVAAVIDGRLTLRERRLLQDARVACGGATDLSGVRRLLASFLEGRPTTRDRG